ncbi:MAG TPA: HAMP domain-containing sensor histidine kinase [Thermoanaerobaculia bacterium]
MGLFFAGLADFTSPDRRVVLVDTRPIQSVTPPFDYDNDLRRFMRLVLIPICPGVELAPVAVGRACNPTAGGVRVELRGDLVAGEAGTAVHAADLAQGLQESLEGYVVQAEGDVLSIAQKVGEQTDVPPDLLVSWLRVQPAVVDLEGQSAPVGTGPFYVDQLWCHESRSVPCSRVGGPPPVRLGELEDWLEDVLVLRRREGTMGARATSEIVVVGLRGEDDSVSTPLVPRTEALARALDRSYVHGVFDVEADLEAGLIKESSGGRSKGWRFSEPRQDRVLVAALRQTDRSGARHLSSQCRSRLVHALARIRQDPTFLRQLGARPAGQLLPEPFEPVHVWQDPFATDVEFSERCEIDLVTNTAWSYAAEEIRKRIGQFDQELQVEVSALSPGKENQKRSKGDYDISLLALVYGLRPDAYYLWDNLRSTNWATSPHVQAAADLAAREARREEPEAIHAAIDELHRDLDAYLIPMGAPTRVVATSDRLLGLDPGGWSLDPDGLRLAPSASEFRVRSLLLVAGVVLLALATTLLFLTRASDRRRRVELSLRMLRHDLLAPLSTIRAYADRIHARDPKVGEALLAEADAALAVAEDAHFVLQEGRPQARGNASTRLRDEVVAPILGSLRRRSSYETGQEPTILLDLPDEPPVSVPPEVARFVVRTLVENAWRHRGGRRLILELAGTVTGGSFHLEVKDHGPGISAAHAERLLQPGYSSDVDRRDFHQGSGMGLHLAWSVLHLHGGEVGLRQAADPTIFTIRFPLASAGRIKPAKPPEKESP